MVKGGGDADTASTRAPLTAQSSYLTLSILYGLNAMNYLPFGERVTGNLQSGVPAELQDYCVDLYQETRNAYEEVGCPLGDSDEAMLIWFTFEYQATCRTRQINCN